MAEIDEVMIARLRTPLTEIEKAEFQRACGIALTQDGAMLARRLLFDHARLREELDAARREIERLRGALVEMR